MMPITMRTVVIDNAHIIDWTDAGFRCDRRSLAIRDGHIVDSMSDDVQFLDGRGWFITAGLVDSHAHLTIAARNREFIDVHDARSANDAIALLAAKSASDWIAGRGFDQERWPNRTLPDKHALDARFGTTPVAVRRVDEHCLWVNSAALARLGPLERFNAAHIGRDAQGAPNGLLYEQAMDALLELLPTGAEGERRAHIRDEAFAMRRRGITTVHEMSLRERDMALLTPDLPLRLRAFVYHPDVAEAVAWMNSPRGADARIAGIKLFLDGALGSRSARLHEAYSDDQRAHGVVSTTLEDARTLMRAARANQLAVALHAIGDAAVTDALDLVSEHSGLRARIEHAQIVHPDDVPRFSALGVAAAVQYLHHHDDAPFTAARLGEARLSRAHPWRALADAKTLLLGGSDYPIADADPRLAIAYASEREGGLSRDEALYSYTVAPARALGEENACGRLLPGYVADMTVWSINPLTATAAALRKATFPFTFVAGEML